MEKATLSLPNTHKSHSILEGHVNENNASSLEGLGNTFCTDEKHLPTEEEEDFVHFSVLPGYLVTESKKDIKKRLLTRSLDKKSQHEYMRRSNQLSGFIRKSIPDELQVEVLELYGAHEIFKHLVSKYEKYNTSTSHHYLYVLMGMKYNIGSDLVKFFTEMKRVWGLMSDHGPHGHMPADVLTQCILTAMPTEMATLVKLAQKHYNEMEPPEKLMDEIVSRYNEQEV